MLRLFFFNKKIRPDISKGKSYSVGNLLSRGTALCRHRPLAEQKPRRFDTGTQKRLNSTRAENLAGLTGRMPWHAHNLDVLKNRPLHRRSHPARWMTWALCSEADMFGVLYVGGCCGRFMINNSHVSIPGYFICEISRQQHRPHQRGACGSA